VEIVEEGKTGYLIPYGDEETLRHRMGELLSDPIFRKQMGEEARNQALSRYRESEYQQKLVEIVNAVIDKAD